MSTPSSVIVDARSTPGQLSTAQDRREWVEAIHIARQILNQPAFDELNDGELSPGPEVQTDEHDLGRGRASDGRQGGGGRAGGQAL